jgi:hypothetical protein
VAKKDDSKKKKASSRGKGRRDKQTPDPYSSIATHPKARASVRKTKGWVALAAFVLAAVLSIKASVPMMDVGIRALIAGCVGYLVAWMISMQVWRHLMIAEQRAAIEEIQRRRAEDAENEAVEQARV